MRSRVPAVLSLALLATLGLAACGDDDDDAADATATTAAPAAEETTTSAPATTAAPPDEAPAEDATVALGDTGLGQVLVDSAGLTLYLFENDTDGVSTCTGGCAETWPALIADSPTAGEGVDAALLGTAPRDDGSAQVTYNGHPLYYFASDAAPGDTNGQAVGDIWYVVDAAGNAVES